MFVTSNDFFLFLWHFSKQMRMVRWVCIVKVEDRVPSKELRERLGIDDISWYYCTTSCDGMGMCCKKKTLIGWRRRRRRTTTTVLWPFVRDYPDEPVPEETLTHPPSWPSSNLYQLLPSTTIHSILLVQITCLAIFLHNLFSCPLWSTSWSGALHLIFHTFLHPVNVFFSLPFILLHFLCTHLWQLVHCNGWRSVWNMRWRAPGQEVDQRGRGERLCKKIAKHAVWTGRMLWIIVDGRSW